MEAHQGCDFQSVLRMLCNQSILKIGEEIREERTTDQRRQELITQMCEQLNTLGRVNLFSIDMFFTSIKVVERACKADIEM